MNKYRNLVIIAVVIYIVSLLLFSAGGFGTIPGVIEGTLTFAGLIVLSGTLIYLFKK